MEMTDNHAAPLGEENVRCGMIRTLLQKIEIKSF